MNQQKDSISQTVERINLPFEQWLTIEETLFFAQADSPIPPHWEIIDTIAPLSPFLNSVALIRIEGNRLCKLNGWQRLQLWKSGTLKPPETITADVYDLTQAEFDTLRQRLYNEQLEQLPPHELVITLYKELGLSFASERLNKGFITEALNIALRGKPRAQQDKRSVREKQEIDIKKAIGALKEELMALDRLNLKPELFLTGVLAAALIMVANDPNTLEFFRRLNKLEGKVSADGLLDPVEALLAVIDSYKNKRMTQARMQVELCGKTVKAVMLWNHGPKSPKYWTKNVLRLADYQPFIRELKRIKAIHEVRDL